MEKASVLKVKICGITSDRDAQKAIKAGADALGFNFYRKSPRYVHPSKAREIIRKMPPFVTSVGIFVCASLREIENNIRKTGIDLIQLHGEETLSQYKPILHRVIKVIHAGGWIKKDQYLDQVKAILIDAPHEGCYGGAGQVFDWKLAKKYKLLGKDLILSGGLNAENVEKAIKTVKPYGVDACSCLEARPGKKDFEKMRDFVLNAKEKI